MEHAVGGVAMVTEDGYPVAKLLDEYGYSPRAKLRLLGFLVLMSQEGGETEARSLLPKATFNRNMAECRAARIEPVKIRIGYSSNPFGVFAKWFWNRQKLPIAKGVFEKLED